jgi:hypothetical protein
VKLWLQPVFWWTMFTVVLLWVMLCVNTIVRKQWMERERLTFPIVQLPLAMTEPTGTIWRNRIFWIGFAVAAACTIINGLHILLPTIPQMWHATYPAFDLRQELLVTKPWNKIDQLPLTLYPFVVGLGFLLPVDLLFSCWFFYFFWKAQLVLTSVMAWDAVPDAPFIKQQAIGAYFAVFAVTLWTGRHYYKEVWKSMVGAKSELDSKDEAMSYRTAGLGILVGLGLLTTFFWKIGLNPFIGFICFIIYFWIAAAIARIRAELGSPVHDLSGASPAALILQMTGTYGADPHGLAAMTYFGWFNGAYRAHPVANEIEGMRMVQASGGSQRKYLYAVLIAGFLGMVSAFWAYLHFSYSAGLMNKVIGGMWRGDSMFGTLYTWTHSPAKPTAAPNIAMVAGFLFCVLLGALRIWLPGFPFHPIGFAISGGWSMNYVWFPLFIAWMIKIIVLRFGGLKLYKKALPFFFGVILGEITVGMVWSLISIIFNIRCFSIWTA